MVQGEIIPVEIEVLDDEMEETSQPIIKLGEGKVNADKSEDDAEDKSDEEDNDKQDNKSSESGGEVDAEIKAKDSADPVTTL